MLDALFKPKAVAVVGASAKELNVGNRIIKNLVDFGFKGAIYPINPKVDEIRGVKAYKSILDVPTDVDVVHLPIPAASVPPVIEQCGQKGVKFVILNGGGFSEIGPVGAAIEEECITIAKNITSGYSGLTVRGSSTRLPSPGHTATLPLPDQIRGSSLSSLSVAVLPNCFIRLYFKWASGQECTPPTGMPAMFPSRRS